MLWHGLYFFSIPYLLHYLDDFCLAARSGLQQHMSVVQYAFQLLGTPLAPKQSHRSCKVYHIFRYRD